MWYGFSWCTNTHLDYSNLWMSFSRKSLITLKFGTIGLFMGIRNSEQSSIQKNNYRLTNMQNP